MCGLVKKMELGVQSYLMARANEPPSSRYAFMTRISTNIPTSQVFPAAEMGGRQCWERENSAAATTWNYEIEAKTTTMRLLVASGLVIACALANLASGKSLSLGTIQSFEKRRKNKNNYQD